jgi:hypothetical protein
MLFRIIRGLMLVAMGGAALGHAWASDSVVTTRDTLVYKDGDRVQGTLVATSGGVVVFKSERFGELRVPTADAVVIKGDAATKAAAPRPATPATAATVAKAPLTERETAVARENERVTIWDQFSPGVLTAKVRNFFGPLHGRVAFSTEVVSDSAERNNHSLEGRLSRKWERDEVQGNARYEYAEMNDVLTTDVLKASGSWRHEFGARLFTQYRPSAEWDRASRKKGGPSEYVLLQQELGVGYNVFTGAARKLRLGVSHNLFDTWALEPSRAHTSRGVPSAFEEIELRLPWQMGFTQRGVWYPAQNQSQGWENRAELNKKLTETLSTSIRHEIRRDNPDGNAQDFTRMKLLLGLDF